MSESKVSKMGLGTFIGLTMALCATVRSIPTLAAVGWTLIFYSIFAVLFFAGPISMVSGELSTMLPQEGGPQLWVKTALGSKWGFVVAWLLWVQMFPGMVMVASTLGPLLGNTFGNVELGNNHWFVLACILVIYWVITLLNLKFDMAKVGGNIGVWLGVYIPVVIMFVLGLLAAFKVGLVSNGYLGAFSWSKAFPDLEHVESLKYLAGITFIFVGIEMSSVYMPRLKDATKNYTKGVFIALIGLVLLNVINAMLVANVVPNGKMELANITQPILIDCQILGLPEVIGNIFSFMVFIGVLLQLSAWVTGPSKTIIQVAREGFLPPKFGFHKENKYGVSKNVVLTQSIVISLFALLYGVMDDVSAVFLTLTNATTVIYCIVYVLIAISLLEMRKKHPELNRPYRIGKSGNFFAWVVSCMLIFSIVVVVFATLGTATMGDALLVTAIAVVMFVIPLIINHFKKDSWNTAVEASLEENLDEYSDQVTHSH
ncbi:amino acid permease [Enterococcus thailandicus]|uniref:Amino acid permease n=3 Tax=root TaxID=1 RepID=A0A179EU83_ENTTH|nr:tyrosine-tyramine antiporter [Enterococcus thailandicus]MDA3966068.1 tyrosine-tyramine antiporter [Enterococcus thailandicus]MDK4352906.1 tyrosine-tyramine antiporter [Enterococcus thailandicus]MDT2734051.1 tyrosine-tyramine antiporter [Enterococcus thailandicus]MDT2751624.1 tyrosine-tyramine antiporter [Enterococcus thailandicus]MDT2776268.1 tyrosine-tyramine antiporter [Enterococcus thailandicus]